MKSSENVVAGSSKTIGRTIQEVLLVTTACALLLATVTFTANDWFSSRAQVFEQLRAAAGIVGHNSVAAMVFDDAETARQTLKSLSSQPNIVGAALYLADGKPFADYERSPDVLPHSLPEKDQGTLSGLWFTQLYIDFDGERVGKILLLADNSVWLQKQFLKLLLACLVFAVSLLLAYFIAHYLQKRVTHPIVALAKTTRGISESRDYSLRAKRITNDEVGALVDYFNDMLDQIQMRDKDLRLIQGLLEEKVDERTRELAELAKKFEHQAYHDALTGLANRITFDNRLQDAILHARRHGRHVSVLFLDLDRFKVVNDTLGHGVGDLLLVEVSQRLKLCLRGDDTLARLGGDEFAILLTDLSPGATGDVANKIIQEISEPMVLKGHNLTLTTSIGISVFPGDGDSASEILKNADTAMYRSKDKGRNRLTFFAPDMNKKMERRLVMENKLRQAIELEAFYIFYQPKVDVATLEIIGVEALLRWVDDELGAVSPAEFIPLAEECGLIGAIDQWVMVHACNELLSKFSRDEMPLHLSVNFSPQHFFRRAAPEEVANVLEETGFPGEFLELEITENLIGPSMDSLLEQLQGVRALGVEISIDDFGTAYSSLSRLKQFPLNTLKIDRSFVGDLGHDADDETLVKTIITMAHNLNLKVVAEGIETEAQYRFVKEHGCDIVQGFLFGKPMSLEDLAQALQAQTA
ncbi:putative bifunctional diguanylate cyclase/phosphodiesterase [Pseudomaricurvus sp.]|uniref:putative bifunctional diguanylate cyclase/phosphodiesterase n=1 Tax=Pseudomaricurvus sp. TaxID=2004510 RepID=UPI003F6B67C7